MSGILYRSNQGSQPKALAGMPIQTSVYGTVIPIVYGLARLAGNLMWYNDFTPTPTRSGGKGGNPVTGFDYKAAIAMALCEGPIITPGLLFAKADKDSYTWTQMVALGWSVFLGTTSQSAWGYVTTNHPTEALAYRQIAYVARSDWPLTSGGNLANWAWEIYGFLPFGGPAFVLDANPKDVISDYLTNVNYGAGVPSALLASLTQFGDYCSAQGLFISPAFDTQKPAMDSIRDILACANSALVWSGGLVKIIPYGDKSLTANGVTFTPDTTVQYDLTDDDFVVSSPGTDPIIVKRTSPADAFNSVSVEFEDRFVWYDTNVVEAKDQASIELYGLVPMPVAKMPWVKDADIARTIAQLILHRALYIRNTYEFSLSWRYSLLEPMDLVSLTDAQLGLNQTVVRIIAIDEGEDGKMAVTAEDCNIGTASVTPRQYPVQPPLGFVPDPLIPPGDTA
jgi:hypothetical protein